MGHVTRRSRRTDVIALDFVAFLAFEQRQLGGRLDALDGDAHAERIAEQDDRVHDRMRFLVVDDVVDEGLIDLDLVEGKLER